MRYIFLGILLFTLQTSYGFSLNDEELKKIGEKIWHNECGGKLEQLTFWNQHESFPSLGIGHFIWYPEGKQERFQETFPNLLLFLKEHKIALPLWLQETKGCPWKTREEFYTHIDSEKMQELRKLLCDTKKEQILFMVNRLEKALNEMTLILSQEDKGKILDIFTRLSQSSQGLYALIDYCNFKGMGTSNLETYNGKGWGLLQVFLHMPDHPHDVLSDFVTSAKKVLTERVNNAPSEKKEERWLQGWLARVNSYVNF